MPEKKQKGDNFKIVRTEHNFKLGEFPKDLETFQQPTLTKPEMSMPVRELLERYQNGRQIFTAKDAHYDGHLPFPDTSRMTKVDRELYRRQIVHEVDDYQRRLDEFNKQKSADKQADLLAKIEELEKNQKPIDEIVE